MYLVSLWNLKSTQTKYAVLLLEKTKKEVRMRGPKRKGNISQKIE